MHFQDMVLYLFHCKPFLFKLEIEAKILKRYKLAATLLNNNVTSHIKIYKVVYFNLYLRLSHPLHSYWF